LAAEPVFVAAIFAALAASKAASSLPAFTQAFIAAALLDSGSGRILLAAAVVTTEAGAGVAVVSATRTVVATRIPP
jgi:hypothetical protein